MREDRNAFNNGRRMPQTATEHGGALSCERPGHIAQTFIAAYRRAGVHCWVVLSDGDRPR